MHISIKNIVTAIRVARRTLIGIKTAVIMYQSPPPFGIAAGIEFDLDLTIAERFFIPKRPTAIDRVISLPEYAIDHFPVTAVLHPNRLTIGQKTVTGKIIAEFSDFRSGGGT